MKTTLQLSYMPPSVNGLYYNKPGKGRVKSERYKVWKQAAGWDIAAQRLHNQRWTTPCYVTVLYRRRRGDIDNRLKSLLDLLVDMQIIKDDSLVSGINAAWDDAGILAPGIQVSIIISGAESPARSAA